MEWWQLKEEIKKQFSLIGLFFFVGFFGFIISAITIYFELPGWVWLLPFLLIFFVLLYIILIEPIVEARMEEKKFKKHLKKRIYFHLKKYKSINNQDEKIKKIYSNLIGDLTIRWEVKPTLEEIKFALKDLKIKLND